jgi:hypothetical protein
MNINEFFRFRNECPVCNSILTREGSIDIMIESNETPFDIGDVDFIGFINYDYTGKVFEKSDKFLTETRQEKILDILFDNFPKTFAMKKKFSPRLGKEKLTKLISPATIYSADLTTMRVCYGKRHYYRYDSQYMFEGEDASNIEVQTEFLDVFDIRITNNLLNNKTNISKKTKDSYNIFNTLPLIPIDKWNTNSKTILLSQIDKYSILK